jgi:putative oxidoreductase
MANGVQSFAYAALRFVAGAMFAFHGVQKIFGVLTDHQPPMWSQVWFGGLIELVCGALIAIGLLTRPAALLASGTMAVAYFQFHWPFEMENFKWIPTLNKGELAVMYAFVFLMFAVGGAGAASVDGSRGRG